MREDIELCDFTAGELSPKLKGRTDYEGYFNGCDTLLNMVALPQGGATRRPGTLQCGLAKDQIDGPFRVRLVPFIFSTVQAYVLEFSNGNIRVYMNDGVVLNGGVPVDITVPYQTADLAALQFVQSADTLFICHPSYPPATLSRSSHIAWTYAAIVFQDGPYLDKNLTTTTLTPSGTSGTITITASSTVGINATPTNPGQGFLASDVGRVLRIRLFSLWAWCLITVRTDATHVTAVVQGAVNDGAYSAIDGKAWAANVKYPTGATVANLGNFWIAIAGGTSAGPNGPDGTGSNIIDGSVTWSMAGPLDANQTTWNTIYVCGDVAFNGGHYYVCTRGGISPGSNFPGGTGTGINWNDTIWEDVAAFTFPTSTTEWRLGKWGSALGYPAVPVFWQQRLCLLGTPNQPSAVEGSHPGDFTNYAPSQADGSVDASSALSWVISDDQVNAIRWAVTAGSSVAMQMAIGTTGAEQIMQPATNSQALSAFNVQVYPETRIGSADGVPALRVGKSVLFVNRSGRKLMDWIWQWAINGYAATERTVDAEHITRSNPIELSGVVAMAYQQQPFGIVWCVRGDGQLIGLTYLPEQKVNAWHRHQLGGSYYLGPPVVESVAVIPSPDGTYDELWMSVLREHSQIGTIVRSIEVMTRFFDGQPQEQAFFADCGIASSLVFPAGRLTTGALSGTGVHFNNVANPFVSGDVGSYVRVNGGLAVITLYVDAGHLIGDWLIPAQTIEPQLTGNWSMTPQYSSFSGADLLDTETVQILGDGADLGTTTVSSGAFTIPDGQTASYVIAGLPYTFDLVTMPWAPKRAMPVPPQGKTKIIDHLYLRLHETLGCMFGRRRTDPQTELVESVLETLETRNAGNVMGQAPPLRSGLQRLPMPGGFDEEGQIEITGTGPYPCTVLAIGAAADMGGT